MNNAKDNSPLTIKEELEIEGYLTREKPLTERMHSRFLELSRKAAHYDPDTLTSSAKSVFIDVYAWNKYRKRPISASNEATAIQKGGIAECESIKLLSEYYKKPFVKNRKRYKNKYLTGIPDIIHQSRGKKTVIEVKTSVDLLSFMDNYDKKLSFDYFFQILSYMELVGAKDGMVCFCLVNLPPEMIEKHIRTIRSKCFLAGNSDERTEEIVKEFQDSMYFDDLPIKRRVISIPVKADHDLMKKVYKRVEYGRKWLKKLIKAHIFGKKYNAQAFSDLLYYSNTPLSGGKV